MKLGRCQVSLCSRCHFYSPEGRRGGQCSQLGVPVESRWKACSLAVPVFAQPLPALQPLTLLPQSLELALERDFAEVVRETTRREITLEGPVLSDHAPRVISMEATRTEVA